MCFCGFHLFLYLTEQILKPPFRLIYLILPLVAPENPIMNVLFFVVTCFNISTISSCLVTVAFPRSPH